MLQTYSTYQAMLSLREFSVRQLAEESGVGERTVRSVLTRHREWLDDLGQEASDKRGGRWRRYGLREAGIEAITTELRMVQALGQLQEDRAADGAGAPSPPDILLAAQATLLDRVPAEEDPEQRERLLASAEAMLAEGEQRAKALRGDTDGRRAADAHIAAGHALLELAHAEDEDATGSDAFRAVAAVRSLFTRGVLGPGGAELETAVRERVRASPLDREAKAYRLRLKKQRRDRLMTRTPARQRAARREREAGLTEATSVADLLKLSERLGHDVALLVVAQGRGKRLVAEGTALAMVHEAGRDVVLVSARKGTLSLGVKAPTRADRMAPGTYKVTKAAVPSRPRAKKRNPPI